jgi:hypothetical protein
MRLKITRVIQLIVQTGFATGKIVSDLRHPRLTPIFETVILVAFYTAMLSASDFEKLPMSLKNIFILPGLAVGKMYSNSVLALLNNRVVIIGGRNMHSNDYD